MKARAEVWGGRYVTPDLSYCWEGGQARITKGIEKKRLTGRIHYLVHELAVRLHVRDHPLAFLNEFRELEEGAQMSGRV